MVRATLILTASLAVAACTTAPPRCAWADFSIGSSHMTEPVGEVFVVRELRGRFLPDFFDGEPGQWIGGDTMIRFQLNGPRNVSIHVPVAPDGTFRVADVRPGRYCFMTSSPGLRGYYGTIIIDPHAPAGTITIKVSIGA
jgi:hypothetical protein